MDPTPQSLPARRALGALIIAQDDARELVLVHPQAPDVPRVILRASLFLGAVSAVTFIIGKINYALGISHGMVVAAVTIAAVLIFLGRRRALDPLIAWLGGMQVMKLTASDHGALIERLGTFRTRHVGHARSTIAAVTAVTLYPNIAGEVRMAEVRIGLRLKSGRREPLVTVRVDASDVLETEAVIERLAERLGVPVEREDRAVSPNHFAA